MKRVDVLNGVGYLAALAGGGAATAAGLDQAGINIAVSVSRVETSPFPDGSTVTRRRSLLQLGSDGPVNQKPPEYQDILFRATGRSWRPRQTPESYLKESLALFEATEPLFKKYDGQFPTGAVLTFNRVIAKPMYYPGEDIELHTYGTAVGFLLVTTTEGRRTLDYRSMAGRGRVFLGLNPSRTLDIEGATPEETYVGLSQLFTKDGEILNLRDQDYLSPPNHASRMRENPSFRALFK